MGKYLVEFKIRGITKKLAMLSKLLLVSSAFFDDIGGGILGGRSLSDADSSSDSLWVFTGTFFGSLEEAVERQKWASSKIEYDLFEIINAKTKIVQYLY